MDKTLQEFYNYISSDPKNASCLREEILDLDLFCVKIIVLILMDLFLASFLPEQCIDNLTWILIAYILIVHILINFKKLAA
jgi:hypothetical protein